jgi:hypothetical protein
MGTMWLRSHLQGRVLKTANHGCQYKGMLSISSIYLYHHHTILLISSYADYQNTSHASSLQLPTYPISYTVHCEAGDELAARLAEDGTHYLSLVESKNSVFFNSVAGDVCSLFCWGVGTNKTIYGFWYYLFIGMLAEVIGASHQLLACCR